MIERRQRAARGGGRRRRFAAGGVAAAGIGAEARRAPSTGRRWRVTANGAHLSMPPPNLPLAFHFHPRFPTVFTVLPLPFLLSLSPPSAARRRHLRRRRRHSRGRSRQRPRRRALSSRGSAVPSASLERLRSFHAKSSGGFLLIVTRFSLAVFVWVSQDLIINVLVHHV